MDAQEVLRGPRAYFPQGKQEFLYNFISTEDLKLFPFLTAS